MLHLKSGSVNSYYLHVLNEAKRLAPTEKTQKTNLFPQVKEMCIRDSDGAMKVYEELAKEYNCEFDERGNIGKRYRRQDEIGTPYCVTFDFDSLEDGAVTVRDRDTMEQERVKIEDLKAYFAEKFEMCIRDRLKSVYNFDVLSL